MKDFHINRLYSDIADRDDKIAALEKENQELKQQIEAESVCYESLRQENLELKAHINSLIDAYNTIISLPLKSIDERNKAHWVFAETPKQSLAAIKAEAIREAAEAVTPYDYTTYQDNKGHAVKTTKNMINARLISYANELERG